MTANFLNQLAAVGRYVGKTYAGQLSAYVPPPPMLLSLLWWVFLWRHWFIGSGLLLLLQVCSCQKSFQASIKKWVNSSPCYFGTCTKNAWKMAYLKPTRSCYCMTLCLSSIMAGKGLAIVCLPAVLLLFLSLHACAPLPNNVCDVCAVFAMEDALSAICALSKWNPFILGKHLHIFVAIPLKRWSVQFIHHC